jgi:Rrf2 family protein
MRRGADSGFRVRDVCRSAGVPEPFTRKVFQELSQEGFLKTVHGPGGGYQFCPRSKKMPLLKLIQLIDREGAFNHCVMGLPECGSGSPCAFHETWAAVKKQVLRRLRSQTLIDLAKIPSRRIKRNSRRR